MNVMPRRENGHGNYYNKSSKGCNTVMLILLWGQRYMFCLSQKPDGKEPRKRP